MPGGRRRTNGAGPTGGVAVFVAGVLAAAVLAGGGCDKPKPKKKGSGTVVVAVDRLPPVDPDSTITVDEGRLQVASPAGWTRAPRSSDCLVRYVPGAQKTFPAIVVLAADPPPEFAEVTTENHKAFVAAVAADLAATYSRDGKSTLLKKPVAITLGDRRGVTWVAPATAKVEGIKDQIERDCIAVVVAGRLVTVEVRAPDGKLDEAGREAARAVAAAVAAVATAAAPAEPAADAAPAEPATEPVAEPAGDPAPSVPPAEG